MNALLFCAGVVAAFVIGFMAGRISGALALDKDPAREVVVDVKTVGSKLDRFNRGPWVVTIAAIILIAIGVQSGIAAQQHSTDTARIAASAAQVKQLGLCVAQYENRLAEALPPVRNASRKTDAADIAFKRAVLLLFAPDAGKPAANAVRRALAHNIKVYEHLTRVRAANPYPTPPRKVCPNE